MEGCEGEKDGGRSERENGASKREEMGERETFMKWF